MFGLTLCTILLAPCGAESGIVTKDVKIEELQQEMKVITFSPIQQQLG